MSLRCQGFNFECPNCYGPVFKFLVVDAAYVAICMTCGTPSVLISQLREITEHEFNRLPDEIRQEAIGLLEKWIAFCRANATEDATEEQFNTVGRLISSLQNNWQMPHGLRNERMDEEEQMWLSRQEGESG
jgi:hypothetical protein